MPIDYQQIANIAPNALTARSNALKDRVLIDQIASDEVTRNALAGYMESQPEQRDARFNELVGADPAMAANVLTVETTRADRAQAQRQQHAQRALTELQAIQKSSNPGLAFRLMAERPDPDNPLRGLMEQLAGAGAINLDDGISDEEAAQIADLAIVQLTPVAGAQDVERADPADVRAMELLGYDLTPEGFAQYNKDKGSEGTTVSDQLAALQAQLAIDQRRDQIERDRRADEEAAEKRRVDRTTLRDTLRRSVTQSAELAEIAENLEGTFLKAGMPASTWRRTGASLLAGAGAAIGMDTAELEGSIANFDKLKKGQSDQLINLMATGGLGEGTNSKLQQYQDALSTPETSLGAILSIQAGITQMMLDAADAQGIEIFDRDKVEANIEKWRHYEAPAGEAVVDVPAIAKMSAAQLEELVGRGAELTDEMIDAAEKRWDELNAGK